RKHRVALVERRDLAAQTAGQEAGPAGDVQHAAGRQRLDGGAERLHLVVPAGPLARREEAGAQPPVVVLGSPAFVIGLLVGAHPADATWHDWPRHGRRSKERAAGPRYEQWSCHWPMWKMAVSRGSLSG